MCSLERATFPLDEYSAVFRDQALLAPFENNAKAKPIVAKGPERVCATAVECCSPARIDSNTTPIFSICNPYLASAANADHVRKLGCFV